MIKASNNFVLFDCKTCSRVSKVGKIAACWTEAHPLDCCIILQIATGKCFKTSCVPGPSTKHHHIWNHIICTDNAFSDIHSHLNLHPLFSSYLSLLILLSWLQRILFPSPSVLLLSSHWLTTVLIFSGWNQIEVFILFLPLLIDPPRCIPPWTLNLILCYCPFSLCLTGPLISLYLSAFLYPTISSLTHLHCATDVAFVEISLFLSFSLLLLLPSERNSLRKTQSFFFLCVIPL